MTVAICLCFVVTFVVGILMGIEYGRYITMEYVIDELRNS